MKLPFISVYITIPHLYGQREYFKILVMCFVVLLLLMFSLWELFGGNIFINISLLNM